MTQEDAPATPRGPARDARVAGARGGDRATRRRAAAASREAEPRAADGQKVGRNDPCHCGSGKKYKKCCLLKGA